MWGLKTIINKISNCSKSHSKGVNHERSGSDREKGLSWRYGETETDIDTKKQAFRRVFLLMVMNETFFFF